MTADNPSPFVPKLRFPEFRDGPRWDLLTLSSASDVNPSNDGLPESFIYIDLESVKSSMLIERKQITRDAAPSRAQRLLSRKDIIYQTVRPYQRNNFFFDINDGYEYVASTGYAQLRAHECPEFLYQLLHTESFVNSVLARCTGSNYPAINPSVFASIHVAQPRKPEQQKIADCLGSLDDLIAADGRKLEALRQHKQGLMQQLFPQPGETVPRLRFPKFRVDTTWLAPQLTDLYGFKRTNTLSRDNLNYEFGTIRNIHYGDIHTKFKPLFRLENEHVPYVNLDVAPDGFDDDAFCEEGDIVLADASEDLDDVGKAIEVVSLNGERVVSGTHTILATRRGSVPVVGFGGHLFQSAAVRTGIKREAQGVKVYGISANRISAIPVPVPPTEAEQQRIATCLSSLEDVLAAQARKIDALKQQKQGLLQQLFPSLETE